MVSRLKGIHILMDGNNTAYRSNCVTEMYTKDGRRTSAIVGVLNTTRATIEQLEKDIDLPVKEVIYAFDKGHSKRRTDLHPDYKGNRSKEQTEDDKLWIREFITQVNVLHDNLPLFGVKSLRVDGWEADDLIYGLVTAIADREPDDLTVIVSTDEDFHQLVSPSTWIYNPIKHILYTYDNYETLTGIRPELFITYKILKGDSSDNIQGIQGIGEKTAKNLVNEYGNMQDILNPAVRSDLMKSKRTARIFTVEGLQTLDRNNQLINLADYVDLSPVSDEIDSLLDDEPFIDKKPAREFLIQYQVVSILTKWNSWIRVFEETVSNYFRG